MHRAALVLVFAVALLTIAYLLATVGLQRRVLYPRPPAPELPPPLPDGAVALRVGRSADVEAWLLPPPGYEQTGESFAVLIFAHGNGELIDHWLPAFLPFVNSAGVGVGVLLVEYPGYGRSGGSPSEASIAASMLSAYDQLLEQPGVDPARIVGYGRSLGGGAVCALAEQRPLAALILESTFTSVREIASLLGVPGTLVLDPFDNLDALSRLELPTLVMHGEHDTLIPVAHGEALARASGRPLVRLPCGHNDCPRPWREILRFLSETGIRSATEPAPGS